MEKTVKAKYLRITPKKMRLIIDSLKKMPAQKAIEVLTVDNKKASQILIKAIKSGLAMFKEKKDLIIINNIIANEGPVFKRWRPGSKGSIKPYKKRTTHLEIVLQNGK